MAENTVNMVYSQDREKNSQLLLLASWQKRKKNWKC